MLILATNLNLAKFATNSLARPVEAEPQAHNKLVLLAGEVASYFFRVKVK